MGKILDFRAAQKYEVSIKTWERLKSAAAGNCVPETADQQVPWSEWHTHMPAPDSFVCQFDLVKGCSDTSGNITSQFVCTGSQELD